MDTRLRDGDATALADAYGAFEEYVGFGGQRERNSRLGAIQRRSHY